MLIEFVIGGVVLLVVIVALRAFYVNNRTRSTNTHHKRRSAGRTNPTNPTITPTKTQRWSRAKKATAGGVVGGIILILTYFAFRNEPDVVVQAYYRQVNESTQHLVVDTAQVVITPGHPYTVVQEADQSLYRTFGSRVTEHPSVKRGTRKETLYTVEEMPDTLYYCIYKKPSALSLRPSECIPGE